MIDFLPNCTFPSTSPSGFVRGPNIRSTMDIIWSCTSIIIISTWSVLHLTVPPDIKPKSKLQVLRKEFYFFGRKISWMGVMLAFPEYLVGISTTNLFASWVNNQHLKELADADDVPWSLTHTTLANMGGIAIRFSDPGDRGVSGGQCQQSSVPGGLASTKEATNVVEERNRGISPTVAEVLQSPPQIEQMPYFIKEFQRNQEQHLAALGEIPWAPFKPHLALAINARPDTHGLWRSTEKYKAKHIAPLHGNIWILDSKQLALARRCGVIRKLPSIESNEIQDKSKSDGLMRLLALIQVLWLAIHLISRRIADIPSTPLEISTVAFSSCAFIIYMAEWPKPKDVGIPFYFDTSTTVSPATFATIARAAPISFLQTRRYYIPESVVHQVVDGRFEKKHIDRLMVLSSILSITAFGGIHLFAWGLEFPTSVEQLLWRMSALTVAIAPTISALLVLLESVLLQRTDKMSRWSVAVLAPLYLASRVYIMVESFRSLYFLPPQAFVSTWATNAPHFD
ncbi:uncharacterized protein PV07_12188 [Cladophialophora immunda]|uniref:Uncharacterized protein n=1 Tax=Cladophialophora immunda TaxID=569365 RepID=A0A0D2ABW5_9EURO|nr:uncharacterized protein PV07_12188 [Cladophialophora immunda]KIW22287.1 hypothetical protein PV07_12188 [Cladophialophora immunda]